MYIFHVHNFLYSRWAVTVLIPKHQWKHSKLHSNFLYFQFLKFFLLKQKIHWHGQNDIAHSRSITQPLVHLSSAHLLMLRLLTIDTAFLVPTRLWQACFCTFWPISINLGWQFEAEGWIWTWLENDTHKPVLEWIKQANQFPKWLHTWLKSMNIAFTRPVLGNHPFYIKRYYFCKYKY